MPYQLARHSVKNYRKWRAVFDEHAVKRRELGSKGGLILRNAQKPEEIVVLLEWGNLAKAQEFMKWGDPSEIGKRAGVVGRPDVRLLDLVDEVSA